MKRDDERPGSSHGEAISCQLYDRITTDRRKLGMSREEYAVPIGVSAGTIERIEQRRGLPNVATIAELCLYFKISPNELLGWDESKKAFTPPAWHKAAQSTATEVTK